MHCSLAILADAETTQEEVNSTVDVHRALFPDIVVVGPRASVWQTHDVDEIIILPEVLLPRAEEAAQRRCVYIWVLLLRAGEQLSQAFLDVLPRVQEEADAANASAVRVWSSQGYAPVMVNKMRGGHGLTLNIPPFVRYTDNAVLLQPIPEGEP